ncbi:hypothetical protein TWF703_003042 [Orbilia oligospora]|uniref:GST N-terminal domain-containing protein n=1 Tax=Orbilia oligospora TaxID=2813651 RepID=A0A7C8NZT0_ORBOL|nr:hypothetical protein TWF703_003042 [Orbilia oligospora]
MSSSSTTEKIQKTYHTKATGNALLTVEEHSHPVELKLYGGCFCPFVQVNHLHISLLVATIGSRSSKLNLNPLEASLDRLRAFGVDPYKGLVPALAHGDWGCYESTVLMEYVDDISERKLLPEDPKQKAYSRLWADHISRNIVPTFYRYLQAQEVEKQAEYGKEFEKQVSPPTAVLIGPNLGTKYPALMHVDSQVNTLLEAADPKGPFFAPHGFCAALESCSHTEVGNRHQKTADLVVTYLHWRVRGVLKPPRLMRSYISIRMNAMQRTDQTLAKWQKLSTRAEDCLEKGLPEKLNLKNA